MPWQARQALLGRDGTIYAPRGSVMEDDDPIALKNPMRVVAVSDAVEVTLPMLRVEPPPPFEEAELAQPEEPEEKELEDGEPYFEL